MWVANCEYTRDFAIGPSIVGMQYDENHKSQRKLIAGLAQISEMMRKIRTTARFLLGNLHDFTTAECISYEQLKEASSNLHEKSFTHLL